MKRGENQSGDHFQKVPVAGPAFSAVNQFLTRRDFGSRQKIQIERVALLAQVGFIAVRSIVISLQLKVIARRERSLPLKQQVSARKIRRAVGASRERRYVGAHRNPFAVLL